MIWDFGWLLFELPFKNDFPRRFSEEQHFNPPRHFNSTLEFHLATVSHRFTLRLMQDFFRNLENFISTNFKNHKKFNLSSQLMTISVYLLSLSYFVRSMVFEIIKITRPNNFVQGNYI